MKNAKKFQTPVLFCVFNRLETTRRVFAVIQKIQPQYLYIAADGPRTGKSGEQEKAAAVRKFIMDNIDWECDTKTLFRTENLGCNQAITSALNWFFEQEEQGIILEDDCLPALSFFPYCAELLDRYKDNARIYHIAGYTPVEKKSDYAYSYHFTGTPNVWGWATWRRAWRQYCADLSDLPQFSAQKKLNKIFSRVLPRMFFMYIFKHRMQTPDAGTWDYRWAYSVIKNEGFCLTPDKNLILNIGSGADATYNTGDFFNENSYEIKLPLQHPPVIAMDRDLTNKLATGSQHILRRQILKLWRKISRGNNLKKTAAFCKNFGFGVTTLLIFLRLFFYNRFLNLYDPFVKKYLRWKLNDVIAQYKNVSVPPSPSKDKPYPIWICWWQGEENMPEIVRSCYRSLREQAKGHPIHLLTKDNYTSYVSLPDYVVNKFEQGFISITHLSDIIRGCLMYEQGGLWVDATVFFTSPPPQITGSVFSLRCPKDRNFLNIRGTRWVTFFFYLDKGHLIAKMFRDLCLAYLQKYNIMLHYFLIDFFIDLICDTIPAAAVDISKIPISPALTHALVYKLSEEYNAAYFEELCRTTSYHKLEWRGRYEQYLNGKLTFYGYLNLRHFSSPT
ncbi:capsular polysaccharide synthesis protein [Candidatus Termititenax aidoneus]|uniref:Capsular polysaccharide synthesis protein n=1 Tax=Termititenax aidoneus TaxID=2218524 RepID=A0A388TDR8_TERA1|nr:capsular polysaccharide synthesis protein [Candidatus Termititenax aidoneus]